MNATDPEQNSLSAPLPLPPLPPPLPGTSAYGYAYPPYFIPSLNYYVPLPAPRRPRVWTVFVAVIVAMVAGLVAGTIVPVVAVVVQHHGAFESGEELTQALGNVILQPAILLGSGAATQLMLLTTALSAAILSPVPVARRLRLNRSTLSPLGYVIAIIGALSVSALFSSVVNLLQIPERGTLKMFSEVFRHLTPTEVAFAVLVVGISPGFAEEFLFRGYAQTRLVQRWGRWIGISVTALLFGAMHMDILQSPFAAAFGFYLGYLAEKTGSIRPTMICHAANNSIQVFLGWYLGGGGGGGGGAEASRQVPAIMAAVALVVLVLCTLYIRLRVRPPAPDDTLPSALSPAAVA